MYSNFPLFTESTVSGPAVHQQQQVSQTRPANDTASTTLPPTPSSGQANDRPPGTFMLIFKVACNSLPLFEFLKRNIQYPPKNLKNYPKNQTSPNSAFTDFNRSCSSVFDDSTVLPSTHIFPKPQFFINYSHDYKYKKEKKPTKQKNPPNRKPQKTPKFHFLKTNWI